MGDVTITIIDGGTTIQVPGASVQVVIGTAIAGTAAAIVATKSAVTLANTFTAGPLLEAATMAALAGGTVLAMRAATITTGTASAVTFTGTGTSVLTLTLDGTHGAYDTALVRLVVVNGGTRGTTGITFKLSFDAGRNYGPTISLGTAVTYAIPNLGVTIAFAAGTLVAGDVATFSTVGPATNAASIQACLNALQASQYAQAFGSMHIVGTYTGANATTLDGYMSTLATGYVFSRAIISARDAAIPVAYGGAGETEAVWTAAVALDFSAVSAKRVAACAAYYNMPGISNSAAGSPSYRRPLSWALAARQVQIPPQRHAGRVKDGSLSNIVVDPTNDPLDGFVYHDERINVGITAARLISARTYVGKQGFYVDQPNLLSATGSKFSIMPYGSVMDVACGIAHQVGLEEINNDIRLNTNGTIFELEAKRIESAMLGALTDQMIATAEISAASVAVDRTNNVSTTSAVNIAIAIYARGYVLNETITIGFAS